MCRSFHQLCDLLLTPAQPLHPPSASWYPFLSLTLLPDFYTDVIPYLVCFHFPLSSLISSTFPLFIPSFCPLFLLSFCFLWTLVLSVFSLFQKAKKMMGFTFTSILCSPCSPCPSLSPLSLSASPGPLFISSCNNSYVQGPLLCSFTLSEGSNKADTLQTFISCLLSPFRSITFLPETSLFLFLSY